MKLTRADMLTAVQDSGFGTDSGSVTQQKNWIDSAYVWVWNAVTPSGAPIRWSFKKVTQASLTVTAGSATPTMPTDFGTADYLDDDLGSELKELDPETFDRTFAAGVVAGETGQPWAYKVVNRQITLGPTPSSSVTFKLSYTRRVSHYNNADAVTAGTFTADTDYPLWPDHHMIVVYHAAMIGHTIRSNPAAVTMQSLRDDSLTEMRVDLQMEAAPGEIWGARNQVGFPSRRSSGWW